MIEIPFEEEIGVSSKEDFIDNVTFNFRDEVVRTGSKIFPKEHQERLKLCLQCGKCVGGCPSGRRTALRIRKIFEEVQLGLREKVFSDESLWNCTTCYTCQERCPRGIPTTDLVRAIRNLAVKFGCIKNRHRKVCEIFLKYGHAVPINDEIRIIRKNLGLAEIPPTVLGFPEGLMEVLNLAEETGFKKMVGGARHE